MRTVVLLTLLLLLGVSMIAVWRGSLLQTLNALTGASR